MQRFHADLNDYHSEMLHFVQHDIDINDNQ